MTIKKITKRKTDISDLASYQIPLLLEICLYEYAMQISNDKNCLSLMLEALKEVQQILQECPQYKQELKRKADGKLKGKGRKSRARTS